FVLHGHAVYGGITVGYAHLVATARLEVAHYEIAPEAVDAEIARFDRAMQTAQEGLQALKAHIAPDAPKEFEAFLDLHRMILNDSALAVVPRELIRTRRANAEWALVQQMERLVERFDEIDDPYLRERKADVQHAVERVLKAERQRLKRLKKTRAATQDGTPIELYANIELPQDTSEVLDAGAEGVGLFRTEFMFLNRKDLPGEEEQFAAYRDVAEALKGR